MRRIKFSYLDRNEVVNGCQVGHTIHFCSKCFTKDCEVKDERKTFRAVQRSVSDVDARLRRPLCTSEVPSSDVCSGV
jgi:hypothetical protein